MAGAQNRYAQRGGTAGAKSLMDETGMTMEEFLDQQRKLGLAGQLIRKRVQPRAIVSWRDIEQSYRADIDVYMPPGQVVIGRILLLNRRDADKIARVKQAFAEGRSLQDVAVELGIKDDGEWRTFTLDNRDVSDLSDLKQEVRDGLKGLEVGMPTAAIEGRTSTSWYCVPSSCPPLGASSIPGSSSASGTGSRAYATTSRSRSTSNRFAGGGSTTRSPRWSFA